MSDKRGTVLITGVGRSKSIGASLALGLAEYGWDLTIGYWAPYDERVGFVRGAHASGIDGRRLERIGFGAALRGTRASVQGQGAAERERDQDRGSRHSSRSGSRILG